MYACRITSLYVLAVMIYATLVNTQTDSFWPVILLAQPAELKTDCARSTTSLTNATVAVVWYISRRGNEHVTLSLCYLTS